MKAHVVSKVLIAAEPSEVFKFLGDLQYHQLWNPHIVRITPVAVLEPDMQYRTSSLLFGIKIRGENKVVKLIPDRELELRNDTGMLRYHVRYRLMRKGENTQVTCTTTVSTESKAFAFARPMMKLLAEKELRTDMDALKAAVEGQLQSAPNLASN